MKKLLISLLALLFIGMTVQKDALQIKQDPAFLSAPSQWVDSVFNTLTPDERIAQLFMIAAYSNKDAKHVKEIEEIIKKYNIGGLIWMQGGPVREGKVANYFQSIAKTPLLYSMDAEWGLSMRLDSTPRYPRQMTLGAIQNDSLIFYMGQQIAKDCKRLGLHINFAPDADVNNNAANPVIGMRSFGEDKNNVARKAAMYMMGMQSEHVMANGKHFPGHGDTESDSHTSLPLIQHDLARLDSLELFPFRYLFERGLASVMVAHLQIPALDTNKNLPSTLSSKIVNDLLKKEMGFKGLIFTDALNMKGAAGFEAGLVEVKALQAGNDVLLFSADVALGISEIKKAVLEGRLNQTDLDESCKKILKAKYWCGLNKKQEIVTRNITTELNSSASEALNDRLSQAAITLLKNEENTLPLKPIAGNRILEISIGDSAENELFANLKSLNNVEHLGITHTASKEQINDLFQKAQSANLIVIQLTKSNLKPANNFGVSAQSISIMDSLSKLKPSILVLLSNPYLMNSFPSFDNYKTVLLGYENIPSMQRAAAAAISGLVELSGKLPVTTNLFKRGAGIEVKAVPVSRKMLEVNYAALRFKQIDSIALEGIEEKAYPGCQIVALQDGKLVYQKSFGNYTYDKDSKVVDNGTMYDLASVTKVAATALVLMKLRSEGKFDYTLTLGDYLPELKGTDKANLKIEDVLAHQAGLQAWIPYFQNTLDKNKALKKGYYSKTSSEQYPTEVAHELYVVKGFRDTILKSIIASKIKDPGTYLYSDLGYYFMQLIIEKITAQSLDQNIKELYTKLGIGVYYKPLNYFSKTQIAPTEQDDKWRKQLVQGYVHDPGAALLGGVAGHAGLFGNAFELSKIMQLYLNKGTLNGMRIIDSNVVNEFTACRYCPTNRRGLCFEKPELDEKKASPVIADCSPSSFGHSGFTGTFVWVEPKNKTVIVFLSNRVYPNADENKLSKLGIRGKIQKAFYQALK